MTIEAGEYKSLVGLDKLYYAMITADSLNAYTVGTPKYLAPAASLTLEPVVNTETQYADDAAFEEIVAKGKVNVTLNVTQIPLVTYAEISGNVWDAVNGQMYVTNGVPPDCALGFRSMKSNGSYLYVWLLKGKFTPPGLNTETKGETPNPQTQEVNFSALDTIFQWDTGDPPARAVKAVFGDEDVAAFDPTNWFTSVRTPAAGASI